ncbi:hypothetical protein VTJ04DRAFT_2684 [Mycothermus thermophilus]|uniref:uncharacterized protein n=1 Tax=Humicola insolens TaxID=85995 RepID=UPI003743A5DB
MVGMLSDGLGQKRKGREHLHGNGREFMDMRKLGESGMYFYHGVCMHRSLVFGLLRWLVRWSVSGLVWLVLS